MGPDQEVYRLAQESVAYMKAAIYRLLSNHPEGLKNSKIGRALGVNADFLEDQQAGLTTQF